MLDDKSIQQLSEQLEQELHLQLGDHWPKVAKYLPQQLTTISEAVIQFKQLLHQGKITPAEYALDIKQTELNAAMVLATQSGLKQQWLQQMLNHALSIVLKSLTIIAS